MTMKINFQLRDIEHIAPWGTKDAPSMHWFGLTDGELWITLGPYTLYEYSTEAEVMWKAHSSRYVDYQLSRFIEDITELFLPIAQGVPSTLYQYALDPRNFLMCADKWLRINEPDENEAGPFYWNEFDQVTSWIHSRTLSANHLVGGPHISFIRHEQNMRIAWTSHEVLDSGYAIWSSTGGSFEIKYVDFVGSVKDFGERFFSAMDEQVERACLKEWNKVDLDKNKLKAEHRSREKAFWDSFKMLEPSNAQQSDFGEVEMLINRMNAEMS